METAQPPGATIAKDLLIAQAQVARQREQIALLEARGADASEAKSLLSALRYNLRILRRRQNLAR
jgi:hypothetical protein